MMDLSDGLSTDLPRLCESSGVGARIFNDSLPLTSLLERGEAKEVALHGGDDYELLFTVSKRKEARLTRSFRGLRLTRVGEITRERRVLLIDGGKATHLRSGGWDPFRKA
jgi:thiamine-monophosphate kinase